jgi:CBS domain-containing protein
VFGLLEELHVITLRAAGALNAKIIRELTKPRGFVKDKTMMIANLACCGEIAIVESVENLKPIGVITDRDIAWRVVATGKSPAETSVRDARLSDL